MKDKYWKQFWREKTALELWEEQACRKQSELEFLIRRTTNQLALATSMKRRDRLSRRIQRAQAELVSIVLSKP